MAPPLHLLHVFPTFVAGGAQMRTVGLMAAFGDELRHSVVPLDGKSAARELLPPEAPVDVLARPEPAGTVKMVRQMRGLLRELSPDIVCTYNWGSIESAMAAHTLGLPSLHHEDGFLPDEARSFKRRRVLTRRFVLRRSRAVVIPSRRLESIALEVWKLPRRLVHWIPNGIRIGAPPTPEARAAARESFGIPVNADVVGGVGHLRGEKNFARLIEAFGALPTERDGRERHLLILGDGPERPRLDELARAEDRRGRVHLPGHLDDLDPAYAAMDVFAISSDTEQMPISLLEAMASALPAASTDVGDVRSMMDERQAELVVPLSGGAAALAAALARLLEDESLRAELGARNRETAAERYDYDRMVNAYRERYEHAAGRSSTDRA